MNKTARISSGASYFLIRFMSTSGKKSMKQSGCSMRSEHHEVNELDDKKGVIELLFFLFYFNHWWHRPKFPTHTHTRTFDTWIKTKQNPRFICKADLSRKWSDKIGRSSPLSREVSLSYPQKSTVICRVKLPYQPLSIKSN